LLSPSARARPGGGWPGCAEGDSQNAQKQDVLERLQRAQAISSEDDRHARAFRDLEGRISDCVTMAGISAQMITNASGVEGEVVFVVTHTSGMLTKLKADYYAAWHGERDIEL
jgi:hypothetical protein